MRKVWFLLVLAGTAGCGGAAGSLFQSPFAGSFDGTFAIQNGGDAGAANVTVGSDGKLNGTVHDDVTKMDGTFTGSIGLLGNFNGKITYPGQASTTETGEFNLTNAVLTGTMVQSAGNSISFTLNQQ